MQRLLRARGLCHDQLDQFCLWVVSVSRILDRGVTHSFCRRPPSQLCHSKRGELRSQCVGIKWRLAFGLLENQLNQLCLRIIAIVSCIRLITAVLGRSLSQLRHSKGF